MNLPPLFRCGHEEATLGPPAGQKVGRVGGVSLQFNAEMRADAGLTPLHVGAKTAPGSAGALPELARRPLWRERPVWARLGALLELVLGKTR